MSAHIQSWIDGHLAVRDRAYQVRGAIELTGGARWPRTTGADVVAIAAVFDDAVRTNGAPGIVRRWLAVRDDLELEALYEPDETYVENHAFWATLEIVAVFLDDVALPAPAPAVWDALIGEIGGAWRNAGPTEDGPLAHFDGIKTFDDLWEAQRKYLAGKRGADQVGPPAGYGGGLFTIPRSTNQDVLQLATYWSDQLSNATHVSNYDTVATDWNATIAEVDANAKAAAPNAVYAKNNEFWRRAFEVAVQVAIGDEAPTKWDLFVGSVKDSIKQLPETFEHAASKSVEFIGDAAQATGKVVGEVGKGLFSGLGAPVLIGAGLLGVLLLSRREKRVES